MIDYGDWGTSPGVSMEETKWLRQPFTPAAIKFRAASKPSQSGNVRCLTYIDARLAAARLSEVDPCWSFLHGDFKFTECKKDFNTADTKVTVFGNLIVGGTERNDVGDAWLSDGEWAKSSISDALKRCAVQFGVGQYLYALGACFVNEKGYKLSRGGTPILNNAGYAQLRDWYAKAIATPEFVSVYGQAIDYGDRVAGEETEVAVAQPQPVAVVAEILAPVAVKATEPESAQDDDERERLRRAIIAIGVLGGATEDKMVSWVESKKNYQLVLRNTAKAALKAGVDRGELATVLSELSLPVDVLAVLFDASELVTA